VLKIGQFLRGNRKYKVLEFLEEGGFSNLYLGLNTSTNRHVVIKVLHNDKFDDFEQEEKYFRREKAFIDIQSKFSMHALQLIDSLILKRTTDNPKFIIITNYIKGKDFISWFNELLKKGPQNFYTYIMRNIFKPLGEYLAFCHEHGLLHRDFSPSNIIISKKKTKIIPVVIDFGGSLNFDPALLYEVPPLLDDLDDASEDYIYTEGYYPPEVEYQKAFLPQSDIYCFGAVLFYCLSLGVERNENNDYGGFVLAPKIFNEECPIELNRIVTKCTQYEPKDRYLSFEEIVSDIKKYLRNTSNSGKQILNKQ